MKNTMKNLFVVAIAMMISALSAKAQETATMDEVAADGIAQVVNQWLNETDGVTPQMFAPLADKNFAVRDRWVELYTSFAEPHGDFKFGVRDDGKPSGFAELFANDTTVNARVLNVYTLTGKPHHNGVKVLLWAAPSPNDIDQRPRLIVDYSPPQSPATASTQKPGTSGAAQNGGATKQASGAGTGTQASAKPIFVPMLNGVTYEVISTSAGLTMLVDPQTGRTYDQDVADAVAQQVAAQQKAAAVPPVKKDTTARIATRSEFIQVEEAGDPDLIAQMGTYGAAGQAGGQQKPAKPTPEDKEYWYSVAADGTKMYRDPATLAWVPAAPSDEMDVVVVPENGFLVNKQGDGTSTIAAKGNRSDKVTLKMIEHNYDLDTEAPTEATYKVVEARNQGGGWLQRVFAAPVVSVSSDVYVDRGIRYVRRGSSRSFGNDRYCESRVQLHRRR